MANDFGGDVYDFQNMTDDEMRGVVLDHLRDNPNINTDEVDVVVENGAVTLTGRVGTDAEVEVASSLLDDVLGLDRFSNQLVVDELRRDATRDDDDDAMLDGPVTDPSTYQSDTAEHLVEDLEGETYGTEDVGRAIRDGSPYSPPDGPFADGYGSREDH